MHKIKEITDVLERLFPLEKAMSYDNPGLLAGSSEAELKAVLLTLDCTSEAVEKARSRDCGLVIAHHPLIFGGINNVCADNSTGKILTALIKNDIALYACHTQLDCSDEFGNLELARVLGAVDPRPLEGASIGVCYDLTSPVSLSSYAHEVVNRLKSSGLNFISDPTCDVRKVFVQGGAFDEDNIPSIIDSRIDLVISGEIKHHHQILLKEYGIASFVAGHNATERVYLPKLKNVLEEEFGDLEFFVDFGNETQVF